MRLVILIVLGLALYTKVNAQFSISSYNKNLQISGYVVGFYNQRFYDAAETNRDKNRFNLDFAVIRFQAANERRIRCELQVNLPAIYSTDPTDEFLMQATAEYRNRKNNF